jgi:hypothetical protein
MIRPVKKKQKKRHNTSQVWGNSWANSRTLPGTSFYAIIQLRRHVVCLCKISPYSLATYDSGSPTHREGVFPSAVHAYMP